MTERETDRAAAAAEVDFGYRRVPEAEKASLVADVFSSVAGRYDLMNDLMSLGVHRLWKTAMVDWLMPRPGRHVVDVGGGTGDIAFRIVERGGGPVTVVDVNPAMLAHGRDRAIDRGGGPVTVVDVNPAMLAHGRDRAIDRGVVEGVTWTAGDAETLPLPDGSADAYTTAFCLRNVTRLDRALGEARRVLRPGGRFLCLEFSRVQLPLLDRLYDTYSFTVLPALGDKVADNREAYQYLAESIRRFPDQRTFAGMIADAGLARVKVRNLSGGIAALHSAWRL